MDDAKTVNEINEVISKIAADLKEGCEIGTRDKNTVRILLKNSKDVRELKYYPCRREHSAKILSYFVKEKGVPQSKYSVNAQPGVFLILPSGSKKK